LCQFYLFKFSKQLKEFTIEIKFLYIKNYLDLTRRDKLDFFKLTGKFENFRILNQKVVLSDSSLLLEFAPTTDIEKAKEHIDKFLTKKEYENVETKILKEMVLNKDQIHLIFHNNEQKRVKITV
jgi:hypothetical protein